MTNCKEGTYIVVPEEKMTECSCEATLYFIVGYVLDLSTLENVFNNDTGDASAYSLGTFFKNKLSAYQLGITSSGKIEHLCRYNTALMVLTGFLTPGLSIIDAFVSKNLERFEAIFIKIVLQCDYLGMGINGGVLSMDHCKIPSNASK
ncbi:hypothetical protein [Teredinibacter turnerae]|uniref:hypothetical protein n=1 Tax=Teredinibacter turnerae TaxID=2426 RepID=UPI0003780A78|nr:hypothetical protein [Teredinibacter turnerae]